ncbi:MAG: hypothetical protein MJK18_10050, partial [Bdellovibrionales bacterium]|nr:hypothetical protein [Bdellovibrionales bacterium]
AVMAIPTLLNLIPLATLAAILFVVGYKLAKPALFIKKYQQGYKQFVPFLATILGIVFTDLLTGITIGFVVSIFFILYQNFRIPIMVDNEIKKEGHIIIELSEDVTFFKKAALLEVFSKIPDGRHVTIDASKTFYIHQDVIDIIEDFKISAQSRDIQLDIVELYEHKDDVQHIHCSVTKELKKTLNSQLKPMKV